MEAPLQLARKGSRTFPGLGHGPFLDPEITSPVSLLGPVQSPQDQSALIIEHDVVNLGCHQVHRKNIAGRPNRAQQRHVHQGTLLHGMPQRLRTRTRTLNLSRLNLCVREAQALVLPLFGVPVVLLIEAPPMLSVSKILGLWDPLDFVVEDPIALRDLDIQELDQMAHATAVKPCLDSPITQLDQRVAGQFSRVNKSWTNRNFTIRKIAHDWRRAATRSQSKNKTMA